MQASSVTIGGGVATAADNGRVTPKPLRLSAGDWVEVRSASEILATLDDRGRLDGLPFTPEMLQYCGHRYRVLKSAHKTCDTIKSYRLRAMPNAVHLDQLRCDGAAHDGCQARCLLFWNASWLKPVSSGANAERPISASGDDGDFLATAGIENLQRNTRIPPGIREEGDADVYSCQATALLDASTPLRWRDPRHYLRDLTSRNVGIVTFVRYVALAAFRIFWRWFARDPKYPYVPGTGPASQPTAPLNLQPGDLVRVRSRDEIFRTLTPGRTNHGLWFDVEMEPLCGKVCKVLARVDHIVDEKTGKMIRMKRDCIILEEGTCGGCLSRDRLFCPRQIYSYWREAWLERV